MAFRYRLRKNELLRYAVQTVHKRKSKNRMIACAFFLGLVIAVYLTIVRDAPEIWTILAILLPGVFWWAGSVLVAYEQYRDTFLGAEKQIRLENGCMTVTGSGHYELPLARMWGMEWIGNLLDIRFQWVDGVNSLHVFLPRRVFPGKKEEEAFIHLLKEQSQRAAAEEFAAAERDSEEEPGQEKQEDGGSEYDFSYTFMVDGTNWAHLMAARHAVYENMRKKSGRYLPWVMRFLVVGISSFLFRWVGFLSSLLVVGYRWYENRGTGSEAFYLEILNNSRRYESMLGEWQMRFSREKISCIYAGREYGLGWKGLEEIRLAGDVYVFCYKAGMTYVMVPGEMFATQRDERDFLEYCREQGVRLHEGVIPLFKGSDRDNRRLRFWKWMGVGLFAVLLLGILIVQRNGEGGFYDRGGPFGEMGKLEYVSLDRQLEILEELEFEVPGALAEEWKALAEEEDGSGKYMEEEPFRYLLAELAFPKYDTETWEVVRYSEQAYWFDWEAFDVIWDYRDILKGVEAMSGGELVLEQIEMDDSRVDWEKGSGTLEMAFKCNGQDCKMTLEVSGDWLDGTIIRKLNQIIESLPERPEGKKVYVCYDGGQGAILFYRDAAWAEKFEEKTGISLDI